MIFVDCNISLFTHVSNHNNLILFVAGHEIASLFSHVASLVLLTRNFTFPFVRSLRAGVQHSSLLWTPALRPLSVQCASPGRGGELIGVCGVCAHCVGWRKEQ